MSVEKILKNLVAECYKGKFQHGNSELKKALEDGELFLMNLKKEQRKVKINVFSISERKLVGVGFAPMYSDMRSNHVEINSEKERIATEGGYKDSDCYFTTEFV